MIKQSLLCAALTLGLACGSAALAQRYADGPYPADENVSYGWAEVLRVDPITEFVRVNQPREVCQVSRTARRGGPDRGTEGAVIGALVGAALGNQVGRGDGRDAATVGGALIGGIVGHNIDKKDPPVNGGYVTTERCRIVGNTVEQERIVGYDVEYRYKGEYYVSRMNYAPEGSRIRVRVSIAPE